MMRKHRCCPEPSALRKRGGTESVGKADRTATTWPHLQRRRTPVIDLVVVNTQGPGD